MPLLPHFVGLEDDDPDNFIATGEFGLRGAWIHETDVFVAMLEDVDNQHFADMDDLIAELARLQPPAVVERVVYSGQASYEYLILQERESGTIRIEYGLLRGEARARQTALAQTLQSRRRFDAGWSGTR